MKRKYFDVNTKRLFSRLQLLHAHALWVSSPGLFRRLENLAEDVCGAVWFP